MKRHKYYAIVGKYTKTVIGVCTDVGRDDVESEEPGSTFVRISKKLFNKFGSPDFHQLYIASQKAHK